MIPLTFTIIYGARSMREVVMKFTQITFTSRGHESGLIHLLQEPRFLGTGCLGQSGAYDKIREPHLVANHSLG